MLHLTGLMNLNSHGQTKKNVAALEHGKNPNLLLIVVLSGVALVALFYRGLASGGG